MSKPDTKTALLDAAEQLFAEHGFAATSLRAVTAAADANLAAVNYHFGSKEELAKAVIARWVEPLNAERFRLLAAAEAESGADPLPLERVVAAFVAPALRLGGMTGDAAALKRLMGRIFGEQPPFLHELMREQFGELVERFLAVLGDALPNLDRRELSWRFYFLVGAMAHTMQCGEELRMFTDGLCDPDDVDANIDRLVTFVCNGLRAPASTGQEEPSR